MSKHVDCSPNTDQWRRCTICWRIAWTECWVLILVSTECMQRMKMTLQLPATCSAAPPTHKRFPQSRILFFLTLFFVVELPPAIDILPPQEDQIMKSHTNKNWWICFDRGFLSNALSWSTDLTLMRTTHRDICYIIDGKLVWVKSEHTYVRYEPWDCIDSAPSPKSTPFLNTILFCFTHCGVQRSRRLANMPSTLNRKTNRVLNDELSDSAGLRPRAILCRYLIGVAGAPGSGKSTMTAQVRQTSKICALILFDRRILILPGYRFCSPLALIWKWRDVIWVPPWEKPVGDKVRELDELDVSSSETPTSWIHTLSVVQLGCRR